MVGKAQKQPPKSAMAVKLIRCVLRTVFYSPFSSCFEHEFDIENTAPQKTRTNRGQPSSRTLCSSPLSNERFFYLSINHRTHSSCILSLPLPVLTDASATGPFTSLVAHHIRQAFFMFLIYFLCGFIYLPKEHNGEHLSI